MKASKPWGHCGCNCGESIKVGDDFVMVEGTMYLTGHEDRRTRSMPAIPPAAKKKS